MNRLHGSARGQVLVLFCLGMAVLLGFMALAVDVGLLWTTRRQMQTAADAAAVAAAEALKANANSSTVTTAGQNAAALNGFSPSYVTINNPPLNGPNNCANNPTNCNNYVEAIIDKPQTPYFLGAFGSLVGANYTTVDVSTRAVGGSINGLGDGGVVTLATGNVTGLTCGGGAKLSVGSGIVVDSTFNVSCSGGVTADSVGSVGTANTGTTSPAATTGVAPMPDPLAYLQAPTCSGGSCSSAACTYGGGSNKVSIPCGGNQSFSTTTELCTNGGTPPTSYTLNPGVYCGGITINGTTVNFTSGLYVLEGGGLSIQGGSANVTGTSVTFYNTGNSTYPYGVIKIQGGGTASLIAPTSGGYNFTSPYPYGSGCCSAGYEGILFWQDKNISNNSQNTIDGGSTVTLTGAMYFPTTPLVYSAADATAAYATIVAYTLTIQGSANVTLNSNTTSNTDGSPIRQSALYE